MAQIDSQLYYVRNVKKKKKVYVMDLDFAKPFDEVDHWLLFLKLKQLGIGGKVGTWIDNVLSDRT